MPGDVAVREPMVIELGPPARLRYVVTGGLLLAVAFIPNGVYVLVTGFQPRGGGRRLPSARPMGLLARLWAGLIPSCFGGSILAVLIVMAARRHVPPLTVVEPICLCPKCPVRIYGPARPGRVAHPLSGSCAFRELWVGAPFFPHLREGWGTSLPCRSIAAHYRKSIDSNFGPFPA